MYESKDMVSVEPTELQRSGSWLIVQASLFFVNTFLSYDNTKIFRVEGS